MSDPRLTRVQAAMTALRPARCVTMARIDEFLARNKVAEAINEADGMRQREPFVHLVNELVDALRALDESQSAKSCPLISDATLAKIVRAMYSADTDAAAEADVFDSIDRDVILEAVVNDKHAEALENARGCLAHRTDGASVIAALEEANEEVARGNFVSDSLTLHPATEEGATTSFAVRLAEQRQRRGLTQAQLAAKTGLNSAAISHFETEERRPSFANLFRLVTALDVSADYLIGRSEKP